MIVLVAIDRTDFNKSSTGSRCELELVEHAAGIVDGDELRGRIERRCPARKAVAAAPERDLFAKPDGAAAVAAFAQARIRQPIERHGGELAERSGSQDQ